MTLRHVPHPRDPKRTIVIGGCKLPRHSPTGLRLKNFRTPAAPASPTMVDWSAAAISVIEDVEGNDRLGDCVLAEDAHYIAVLTGNANALYAYTQAQTIADYSAITGYNPADPNTDQGADPTTDLNYRVATGYADGSKDIGWMLVDASDQADVEYAINTFGNLKLWFGIPDSIVNNMPSASGFVWDVSAGSANPNNGHCIGSCGYNVKQIQAVAVTVDGVLVMTWGMLGLITWAAMAAWFVPAQGGGAAVRVSSDWISKATGNTPAGLNLVALTSAFNSVFGGNLNVTPPAVVPTGPASLANVQAWAAAGIQEGDPLQTQAQAIVNANAAIAKYWPASP